MVARLHNWGVRKQVLLQVLRGTADANIRFDDLRALLSAMGFAERVKGSHHIFAKPPLPEILNLQPKAGFLNHIRLSKFGA